MPASLNSRYRSFPSRVRSPTPQNTDRPPWPLATLLISSWMTTVLPTPAPPKRPIFPPFTNGAIRSTTLMPVSKISVLGSRFTKSGRLRWIGHRSTLAGIGGPLSTGSPITLRMRPNAASPTGTVMALPVSTTSMPRTTPSVDDMATARTWLRPMCCCTSATTLIGSPVSDVPVIESALYSSGRCPASNSTSSTGPMIWTILPTVAVAVMGLS